MRPGWTTDVSASWLVHTWNTPFEQLSSKYLSCPSFWNYSLPFRLHSPCVDKMCDTTHDYRFAFHNCWSWRWNLLTYLVTRMCHLNYELLLILKPGSGQWRSGTFSDYVILVGAILRFYGNDVTITLAISAHVAQHKAMRVTILD